MKKICYIVGAGDGAGIAIDKQPCDLVIAADGGFAHLQTLGIVPDVAVGDFDSLCYVPDCAEVIAHPPEKDDTDTALAIDVGRERGYDNFIIFGGLGGRIEHSMANIQSIAALGELGCRAWLWGEDTAVTVIKDTAVHFSEREKGYLSVFSHGDVAQGVCLENLKYEVDKVDLLCTYGIGVSNEFIGKIAEVSVENGMLLLIWHCTASELCEEVKRGNC